MNLGLKGKVALITGAGRGIGRATALAFAGEGTNVVVNDIDTSASESVAQEAIALGSRAIVIKADVTNANQVNEMVKRVLIEFERVDILVNNAGVAYTEEGPMLRPMFVDSTVEDWQKDIDVILYGTLNCTKALVDHMIRQKSGRIVNIASLAAIYGGQGHSVYSAAKGGIMAFTTNLAAEVGEYGITVNAVAPGTVQATRAAMIELKAKTHPEEYRSWQEIQKFALRLFSLGRFGRPEDIANAVVFLASDAASWITGQTLRVDGGQPISPRNI